MYQMIHANTVMTLKEIIPVTGCPQRGLIACASIVLDSIVKSGKTVEIVDP